MKRIFGTSLVLVAVLLGLAGCQLPMANSPVTGQVLISVGQPDRTILPAAIISSYSISGTGPSGASLPATAQTSSSFTIQNLASGSWTLVVNGLDASGNAVASGSQTVTINAGSTTAVTIDMGPVTGTGTFSLSLSWTGTATSGSLFSGTVSSVTGTYTPQGSTTATPFTATVSGNSATVTLDTLAAGSYLVTLILKDTANKQTVFSEALQIFKGLTSTKTVVQADLDKAFWSTASSTAAVTVSPPSVTGGAAGTPLSFTIQATGLPSTVSSVTVKYNFGDGSSTATGTETVAVTSGTATNVISHTYTVQSSYGLTISVLNGTTVLASGFAAVTIGTAQSGSTNGYTLQTLNVWQAAQSGGVGLTVDTWNVSSVPTGATFDFKFDAQSMPDKFIIEYPIGQVVLDTGWRGASNYNGNAQYPGGVVGSGVGENLAVFRKVAGQNSVRITAIGGASGTVWDYSIKARN